MADRIESLKVAMEAENFLPWAINEVIRTAEQTGSVRGYLDNNRVTRKGSEAYSLRAEEVLYAAFGEESPLGEVVEESWGHFIV